VTGCRGVEGGGAPKTAPAKGRATGGVRCRHFLKADLREFNGEADHVHLLVFYPPKVSVSALVNSLKGVSARMLRSEYTGRVNRARMNGHFWSPSYFAASCGGAPLSIGSTSSSSSARPDGQAGTYPALKDGACVPNQVIASIGSAPIVGPTEGGIPVDLSGMEGKRDGSGTQLTRPLAIVGSTRRVHVQ
jgi:putative transposase